MRRIAGLQPAVGDELGFGMGLHELLQRRTESESEWDEAEVDTQVNSHVYMPLSPNEAETRAKRAIKNRLMRLDELGAFDGDVQQELPVQVLLNGGVVTGVVDFVLAEPDGSLVVRDWKANVHEQFLPRYARQLQVYAHALRAQEHTVRRAELVDVAASSNTGRLVTVDVDIEDDAIARIIQDCQRAMNEIQSGEFSPQPSPDVCGSCDVRRICAEREGVDLAET